MAKKSVLTLDLTPEPGVKKDYHIVFKLNAPITTKLGEMMEKVYGITDATNRINTKQFEAKDLTKAIATAIEQVLADHGDV